jgi:hypothetical protein
VRLPERKLRRVKDRAQYYKQVKIILATAIGIRPPKKDDKNGPSNKVEKYGLKDRTGRTT